jgi:hypothetical protein
MILQKNASCLVSNVHIAPKKFQLFVFRKVKN